MNSALASALALVVLALLIAPLLWGLVRPSAFALNASLLWALGLAFTVALLQSGLLAPRPPEWVTDDALRKAALNPETCAELTQALRQYGVLTVDPQPGVLIVNEQRWRQLPSNIQDYASLCAARDGEPATVTFR